MRKGWPAGPTTGLVVDYPLDGSVFPPEFVPPTFVWHDEAIRDLVVGSAD